MIIKIRLFLARIWRWYRHRELYVIADPCDNSVTLSRLLFEHMGVMDKEQTKVFVFKLCNAVTDNPETNGATYAFSLNVPSGSTQLCDIQYNAKHRTIGFETLCPSVNRIFYDYGLPSIAPVKLSIEPCSVCGDSVATKIDYYIILPPHAVPRP